MTIFFFFFFCIIQWCFHIKFYALSVKFMSIDSQTEWDIKKIINTIILIFPRDYYFESTSTISKALFELDHFWVEKYVLDFSMQSDYWTTPPTTLFPFLFCPNYLNKKSISHSMPLRQWQSAQSISKDKNKVPCTTSQTSTHFILFQPKQVQL